MQEGDVGVVEGAEVGGAGGVEVWTLYWRMGKGCEWDGAVEVDCLAVGSWVRLGRDVEDGRGGLRANPSTTLAICLCVGIRKLLVRSSAQKKWS